MTAGVVRQLRNAKSILRLSQKSKQWKKNKGIAGSHCLHCLPDQVLLAKGPLLCLCVCVRERKSLNISLWKILNKCISICFPRERKMWWIVQTQFIHISCCYFKRNRVLVISHRNKSDVMLKQLSSILWLKTQAKQSKLAKSFAVSESAVINNESVVFQVRVPLFTLMTSLKI